MNHSIRPATTEDLDDAAGLLAAAFHDYPWTRWSIPAEGYSERLEELQRLYLAHALDHGLVLVESQLRAVAAFLPPNAPAPTEAIQERVGELLGERLALLAQLSLPAAADGAWTLETVGVDPADQGAGLGTAVIAAGLELIDERSSGTAGVALQTSATSNERLYQRLGFTTATTTAIPRGPVVYSMARVAARAGHS